MNNQRIVALNKAKELINKRKEKFYSIPEIKEFDDGNIFVKFFKDWKNLINGTNKKTFNQISITNNKEIYLLHIKKGKEIEIHDNLKVRYMCLNGSVQIDFNDEKKVLNSFEYIEIPKYVQHNAIALLDTYIIIIEKY